MALVTPFRMDLALLVWLAAVAAFTIWNSHR